MIWYPVSGPAPNQCSTSCKINLTLCLNAFRGEPASSWLDWHFTPNHNSSADFSTSVGSILHVVLPTLQSGHGQIAKVRVYLILLNALFRLGFPVAPGINPLTLQYKITRRLILQQARYHPINRALTDCKLTVSGSISLSFSLFFSPFRHRTRSLSVTDQYLALPDGPGGFRQGFTCPALLGKSPKSPIAFDYRAITVYGSTFQLYSSNNQFCNFLSNLQITRGAPTTPSAQRLQSITYRRFRLFPFRSPLLWESLVYFLFVLLLRCFSSQAFLCSDYEFI